MHTLGGFVSQKVTESLILLRTVNYFSKCLHQPTSPLAEHDGCTSPHPRPHPLNLSFDSATLESTKGCHSAVSWVAEIVFTSKLSFSTCLAEIAIWIPFILNFLSCLLLSCKNSLPVSELWFESLSSICNFSFHYSGAVIQPQKVLTSVMFSLFFSCHLCLGIYYSWTNISQPQIKKIFLCFLPRTLLF